MISVTRVVKANVGRTEKPLTFCRAKRRMSETGRFNRLLVPPFLPRMITRFAVLIVPVVGGG